MPEDADGKVRVWGKALAYRTPDDPLPTVGHSYLEVPGATPYTRGSEIENVETSAWGRAIGALGIGISESLPRPTRLTPRPASRSASRLSRF